MPYSFSTANVVYGLGARAEIAVRAARHGRRCLLLTGKNPERIQWLSKDLGAVMDSVHTARIGYEPETGFVASLAAAARDDRCEMVVAVGGGSVIDAGKAVAALITNPGDVTRYVEIIGAGEPLAYPPVPMIAVPTTAGTGAEVTANAVLLSPEHGVKVSLRSPMMIPRLAIVDPELTVTLPPAQTASTGMDALTQLLEAFVSHAANPLADPLCRDGMLRAGRSLRQAVLNGRDLRARSDMALAGLFSGMALANARLGAVHGFAAPLGGMLGAAHGEICAALLPHVMEANILMLRRLAPQHQSLGRYTEVARLLTDRADATAEDGATCVSALCRDLGIGGLAELGLTEAMVPDVAEKASRASSMRGNPVDLSGNDLQGILRRAMAPLR